MKGRGWGKASWRSGCKLVASSPKSSDGKTWLDPKQGTRTQTLLSCVQAGEIKDDWRFDVLFVFDNRIVKNKMSNIKICQIAFHSTITHDEHLKEECGSVHSVHFQTHSNTFWSGSQMKMHIFNSQLFPDWSQLCTVLTGWKLPMHPSLPKF